MTSTDFTYQIYNAGDSGAALLEALRCTCGHLSTAHGARGCEAVCEDDARERCTCEVTA